MNRWLFVGALFGFLGVALGAFGAHSLAPSLGKRGLSVYLTAVQYQMFHALALVAWGIWTEKKPEIYKTYLRFTGWCFALGILLFSGSLYAITLVKLKTLGAITPIGGSLLLLGWFFFLVASLKRRQAD